MILEKWLELSSGLLLAVYINAALGGVLLAVRFGMMAHSYYADIRKGANGLSRSMFAFFLALTVHCLFLSLAFTVLLFNADLITIPRILIAGSMLALAAAVVYLHLEAHREQDK